MTPIKTYVVYELRCSPQDPQSCALYDAETDQAWWNDNGGPVENLLGIAFDVVRDIRDHRFVSGCPGVMSVDIRYFQE